MDDSTAAARGATRITYVGHGTVLIEQPGLRILTDPLLRRWAGPLRRLTPPPDPAGPASRPDLVLVSHLHIDHLDVASLRRVDRRATVLIPAPGARVIARLGFTDVREVADGDVVAVGDGVTVTVVPARHLTRRHPLARPSGAVGFVVGGAVTTYYAGDTAATEAMAGIAAHGLDLALLPVWGWGPTLPDDDHLTPLTAARCLRVLRPRLAVPVHWGTYAPAALPLRWRREPEQPARSFARYAARLAPQVQVRVLAPGEATIVPPHTAAGPSGAVHGGAGD